MLPASDDASRNVPLLPRSASFGQGRGFDPLGTASAYARTIKGACNGDLLALKSACVIASCASFAVGLLTIISPFSVLSPLHLLTGIYIVPTSLVLLALEVEMPFLAPFTALVDEWFRFLTLVAGRGAFYIVVGTLVAGLGDPLALAAGVLHIGAGGACLWTTRQRQASEVATLGEDGGPSGRERAESDVPRQAFRRRVLYGMQKMDSAELVALCLELGLSLGARARLAALAVLDPHEDGVIEEGAFVEWWEMQHGTRDAYGPM